MDQMHYLRVWRVFFGSMGVAGQACVLRAVCEVAERPVEHLGMTGELINLFFR